MFLVCIFQHLNNYRKLWEVTRYFLYSFQIWENKDMKIVCISLFYVQYMKEVQASALTLPSFTVWLEISVYQFVLMMKGTLKMSPRLQLFKVLIGEQGKNFINSADTVIFSSFILKMIIFGSKLTSFRGACRSLSNI